MFSLLTFLTLTILFSALLTFLLIKTGILVQQNRGIVFFVIAIVSIIVGTIISNYAGRHPLTAIIAMSNAAQEVAKGNFDVSLNENIRIKDLRDMAHNFNLMAKELAGTEILRTDFVENVSHEFKTPLSAIEGYTTLLQRKDLSEEKRQNYTKKILYNTRRLSTLTSNILLLSRLENQEIGIKRNPFVWMNSSGKSFSFWKMAGQKNNWNLKLTWTLWITMAIKIYSPMCGRIF